MDARLEVDYSLSNTTSMRFPLAAGSAEASSLRVNETRDIVKRIGIISPDRVYMDNYPVIHPPAVFNSSMIKLGSQVYVYARIISGYYMYVSGIIELAVPFDDLENGGVNYNRYTARLVVYPSTRYDLWGAEDPRVYFTDGKLYMTYTGRTVSYFDPSARFDKTLPVTAVKEAGSREWVKMYVHKLPAEQHGNVVSNKDAFAFKYDGYTYFFHRPYMDDEQHYLLVGREGGYTRVGGMLEVALVDNIEVLKPSPWEEKLGWSTPPITASNGRIIVFLHAVDRELKAYRLLAIELELRRSEVAVTAVTPRYIMEPRELYEVFGDRPYTIFPCGVLREKDEVYISYGAGDYVIGFGRLDLAELESELDKGRIG